MMDSTMEALVIQFDSQVLERWTLLWDRNDDMDILHAFTRGRTVISS